MTAAEMVQLLLLGAKIETYGQFAALLREMKQEGWTKESAQYVMGQVFYE